MSNAAAVPGAEGGGQRARRSERAVDVCIIVEGAYPYVAGGVSNWLHELLLAQRELRFHLLVLNADEIKRRPLYSPPRNVVGVTEIALQRRERVRADERGAAALIDHIEAPLRRLLSRGDRADFAALSAALRRAGDAATRGAILNSEAAFAMLQRMYTTAVPASSFLYYFWSWRALVGGLVSVLLADLPTARVYHAISTGYAGLMMARAVVETGRPGLLTEHGIYTNERRIEIAMASWMSESAPASLATDGDRAELRDLWLDAFIGYSRACYECCSRIVTLYAGNQSAQRRDGAPAERQQLIANGIDVDAYAVIGRHRRPSFPVVALIGRVVPLKDVKTFIRAVALLRDLVAEVHALVLGPTDEDPAYYDECIDMVRHFALGGRLEFRGRVALVDALGGIDVVALTSLSEAQPLVLLEAGAAGIPSVATDVGACREIIEGRAGESPPLGPGGIVTPLGDPRAIAAALAALLLDEPRRRRCGEVMRQRVRSHYSKDALDRNYRELYAAHLAMPAGAPLHERSR